MRIHIAFLVSLSVAVPMIQAEASPPAAQGPGRGDRGPATQPVTRPAPAASRPAVQNEKVTKGPVELRLSVSETGGKKVATLEVTVAPGHHLYAPGTDEGIPITVELAPGSAIQAAGKPKFPAGKGGHLAGTFQIEIPIKGNAPEVEVVFGFQACDEQVCYPPVKGVKVKARS